MKRGIGLAIIILAFLIGVFFFTKGPSYPNPFTVTDISSKILTDRKQDFSGATLVNLDEDPEQEIFISGHGTSNLLLKRKKDKFYPLEISELTDSKGLTFSVSACDLDQDGRDEILIINRPDPIKNDSRSRILKFVAGKWKDILPIDDPLIANLNHAHSASCIDRMGDGKYGLAVTNENGKISYLEIIGTKIIDIAGEIGIALNSQGRSILGIPGPTGRTSIFIGNENGTNFYFVNNGNGTFTEKAKEAGVSDPLSNARGISLIDVNHDDLPDIVYGNNLGPTRLLEQTRDGKFKDVTPDIMKINYAVNSTVVGDFNLDGYEDLYLNNIRGHNNLFARYSEDWHELDVSALSEKEMFGVSTIAGDLDKNGSYEILNTHGDGSHFPITLYTIKPVGKWIKFSIKYQSGGIPRGSIIKLRTSVRDQIRVISSGSGRFANYDEDVLFGLLKNESIISLEVILPSGIKVEYTGSFKLLSNNVMTI